MEENMIVESSPKSCLVRFHTSQGDFTLKARKKWSPIGYERFYNLVKERFFDDMRLFRVIKGYVVQFGISGSPEISKIWKEKFLQDEKPKISNLRGTMAYAMDKRPDSRTTQVYINYADNTKLDDRFTPFAEVIDGMEIVDKFYNEYGRIFDDQALQDTIEEKGNIFLDENFPKLDKIISANFISVNQLPLKSHFKIINNVLEPEGMENLASWCKSLPSIQTCENSQLLYRLLRIPVEFSDAHQVCSHLKWSHLNQCSLKQKNECALMKALFLTMLSRFGKEQKLVGTHTIRFSMKRFHLEKQEISSNAWHYDLITDMTMIMVLQNDFKCLDGKGFRIAFSPAVEPLDHESCQFKKFICPKLETFQHLEHPEGSAILFNNKKVWVLYQRIATNILGTQTIAKIKLEKNLIK